MGQYGTTNQDHNQRHRRLFNFLKARSAGYRLDRVRKTIDSKLSDNRKLEACRYLGLHRAGWGEHQLSGSGRRTPTVTTRHGPRSCWPRLRASRLYFQTVE